MPARSIAPFAAVIPRSTALTPANEPPKLPIAVLAALTITTSFIFFTSLIL